MKSCCLAEARRSLRKHRDVAVCDDCGRLLLAYANERDFESTLSELTRHGIAFETAIEGPLQIVAKPRTRSAS
jgi:hypothetical protein